MALETPNRMAASINFFFADANQIPPDLNNDTEFVITALEGVEEVFLVDDDDPSEGFFLQLQNPVNVAQASWFVSGPPGGAATDGSPLVIGATPLSVDPGAGDPVDEWAASNGNFLALSPVLDQTWGWFGVAIFEIPRVDDAELPALPLAAPPAP
jgi:hypothetical protein